ncbi:PH domain-containing protein [Intrasporangium calvum]|uniref:PH domain-containing protein n=1 Tax=Intrasporangium calvum TaxID=53358 RepID=A0ABT5GCK7_9MICO|nr:PH domain-containing protein [Intrasporangium calvum]MDC5696006.1 PH domain-containing protein [Intrasporangium calvum]
MGFPENVLAQGERVERSIHPHWLTVVGPMLFGLVLVAGAAFAVVATPDDSQGNIVQWVLVGLAVLIAVPTVLVPFLRWRTTHYVVTSHRVMVRRGILRKSGKDITLSKITDVSFEQSLLDRIINSGSLRIESAGDSPDEQLRNIPHSNHVQQLINRLIDEDDTRRRMVASGRAAHGRPGYEPAEDDDEVGRMPLGSERRRRDRPPLAEE